MLEVGGVLGELDQMHLHMPSVDFSAEHKFSVFDLAEMLRSIGGRRRWPSLECTMSMKNTNPSMVLINRPRNRLILSWRAFAMRKTLHATVAIDLPAVKRTLNIIAAHGSIG